MLDDVVGFVRDDCGGRSDLLVTGCSLGAFHAANLALRHADLAPQALCLSGSYDPSEWQGWGERGEAAYFHNPTDYVANLGGGHLDWLRSAVFLVLVVGQGVWEEHPTRALPSTRRLADILADSAFRTSSTCGATMSRTTGRRGSASWRTTCPASADGPPAALPKPGARTRAWRDARPLPECPSGAQDRSWLGNDSACAEGASGRCECARLLGPVR